MALRLDCVKGDTYSKSCIKIHKLFLIKYVKLKMDMQSTISRNLADICVRNFVILGLYAPTGGKVPLKRKAIATSNFCLQSSLMKHITPRTLAFTLYVPSTSRSYTIYPLLLRSTPPAGECSWLRKY